MEAFESPASRRNVRVVQATVPRRLRTAWISDVHLGSRTSNAAALLDFLRDFEVETLYIVGDLIDGWQMRRGIYWPQQHNDVIQKLLRKARKGTRIVYIPGNHDEFVAGFCGYYGHIAIQTSAIHETADGRRILVLHGHELDTVVQNARWLAFAGDLGYQFLLSLNPLINFVRRRFGLGYWSLSAYAKTRSISSANSKQRLFALPNATPWKPWFADIFTAPASARSAASCITIAVTGLRRVRRWWKISTARLSCSISPPIR
jgi:UDP-2,3-diacylglucosamine pyrophosphatase LpxH